MRWSESQFTDYETRRWSGNAAKSVDAVPVDEEGKLHEQIEAELIRRRWYYVHSRMDRPTTQAKGVPDFQIAAPGGVTFWVECKRKGGKLTQEQTVARHVLQALGHRYALVYSFAEFLEAIDKKL